MFFLALIIPIVDGGPSEGAVQVKEGSYGGRSSGEVRDISISLGSPEWIEILWFMFIVSEAGGGLRLYWDLM